MRCHCLISQCTPEMSVDPGFPCLLSAVFTGYPMSSSKFRSKLSAIGPGRSADLVGLCILCGRVDLLIFDTLMIGVKPISSKCKLDYQKMCVICTKNMLSTSLQIHNYDFKFKIITWPQQGVAIHCMVPRVQHWMSSVICAPIWTHDISSVWLPVTHILYINITM